MSFNYPTLTEEEKEQRNFREMLKETHKKIKDHQHYVRQQAKELYEYWLKEDFQLDYSKTAQKAFKAAEAFYEQAAIFSEDFDE